MKFDIKSTSYNECDIIDVTYCIPSFNHDKYIIDLLDSIRDDISSSSKKYEILILDDGSTDNTFLLLNDYIKQSDVSIRGLFFDNVGLAKNLNRMKKFSNGKWIRLCASDDLIVVGKTEIMLNSAKENTLAVISDGYVINKMGDIISESSISYHKGNKINLIEKNKKYKEMICNFSLSGPCALIRSNVYDFFNYNPDSLIEDYDFFITLLLKSNDSLLFLDERVYYYRIHDDNTSKTGDTKKRIRNQKSMLKLINDFIKLDKHRMLFFRMKIIVMLKIVYLSFINWKE
jgi:glycosyltransferase involved in cell wall biosynthesis